MQGVLRAPSDVETSQALSDIWREPKMVLNGVQFRGDGRLFVSSLQRLAHTIIVDQRGIGAQGDRLIEALVQHCARTSAGADAYFAVEKLLGINNNDASINMVVAPKREAKQVPIDVQCLLRDSKISCQIVIHNSFSVYRPFTSEDGMRRMSVKRVDSRSPATPANAGDDLQVEVANEWVTMHTIVTDAIILSPADEPRAKDWIRSLRVATLGST
jgi:hypothetical protein|mmetsp:Transcript_10178/g.33262  ORF Transcript_10178/g.33262 Transcript_10178/m.33262 type:complete len:215 (+) Transcript_10178:231-875(+)